MATLEEVRKGALELLGRADPYNTVDTTLDTAIGNEYTGLWNNLERRSIVFWGLTEDVPDEFRHMVEYLLAFFYGAKIAVSDTRWQRIIETVGRDGEKGFKEIRRLAKGINTNEVVPGNFI